MEWSELNWMDGARFIAYLKLVGEMMLAVIYVHIPAIIIIWAIYHDYKKRRGRRHK